MTLKLEDMTISMYLGFIHWEIERVKSHHLVVLFVTVNASSRALLLLENRQKMVLYRIRRSHLLNSWAADNERLRRPWYKYTGLAMASKCTINFK
jgi:hypothetical protein